MVLAAVGQFDLLHKLYGHIIIPEAVYPDMPF
jgi:predicted nucleic acid-binding protein